jgi:tetratricopeptide (TPR) repeat protein
VAPRSFDPVYPTRRGIVTGFGIGAAAVVTGLVLGRIGWDLLAPPPAAPSTEIEDLYARALYLWEKRTPESLREARGVFETIVARAPTYAPGYAGLANTFNLLREYSVMPAPEAYAAAAKAGREAVRLDPTDADAQCALAFAEFYGLRQITSGLSRFKAALKLEPNSAQIHHWYGNALLHLGSFETALAEVETAQRLDPGSRAIRASKGLALFCVGRLDEAYALLTELSQREPDFLSPIAYLAYIDLARGDYASWLDRMEQSGRLREDNSRIAVAAAGRLGLETGGYLAMVNALIGAEQRQLSEGTSVIYNLARMEALSGDGQRAVQSLRRSIEANEEMAMGINIDPAFAGIRTTSEFHRFAAELGIAA